MSLAKVTTVKAARKDQGTCGKCGVDIKKGDSYIWFAVGFRGRKQVRCSKPSCYPPASVRESSMVADVYAAQEDADSQIEGAETQEDFEQIKDDVVAATEEVVQQYQDNEMYEANYDLQERADMLEAAAGDLDGWEPPNAEPEEDSDDWKGTWPDADDFDAAHAAWVEETRESLRDTINMMDLP